MKNAGFARYHRRDHLGVGLMCLVGAAQFGLVMVSLLSIIGTVHGKGPFSENAWRPEWMTI